MAAVDVPKDLRYDWLQCRVQSSLSVDEDVFLKILQNESKSSYHDRSRRNVLLTEKPFVVFSTMKKQRR